MYCFFLLIFFFKFISKIVANARRLCDGLQKYGYKVVTGGTDVHLVLVDLRSAGITGARAEKILEDISIACNKNTGERDYNILCICKFSLI
jgi:glycine hydroxymethyltransferase